MKTNKQHFEIFKKECEKWIDRFELNNYHIMYEHKKLKGANAKSTSGSEYNATLCLCEVLDWDLFIKKTSLTDFIKNLAKHEVLHVLLGRFRNQAESRFINENELVEAEEELVRKLIKIIKD